ncbi:28S ribosomal protein S23, mitochondrial [Nematolebias whitei]|uniref:28S ribosomal protein S23, mitochondrial n=1 Tax=Nematolebias whitei TaxID=451745 RepID=UPI001899C563|nr:28S ribosomal protein S23, mitochondrial [Nematolebias whitei]
MAGSRLERFGTVFSRVQHLMLSGVMKPADKPIWYDVYEAFPPKREPFFVKPHYRTGIKKHQSVPEIFYQEDEVRARFYEQYGPGSQPFDLFKPNFVSTCQRFVMCYTELKEKSHDELEDSALFLETGRTLLSQGIFLRKRALHPVEKTKDDVFEQN